MADVALLDDLRQRVADREPVDWDACTRDPQVARALSDDDLREIALLRVLDEIGVVHTQLQTGTLVDEDAPGVSPVAVAGADDTLQTWGRYRLEAKVGRGGFGSVYRAWDPVLEMDVAIKILHRRSEDRQLTERLLREGRVLAQITHPNVVRVLNVEEHEGRLGLVMEFVRGETMDEVVASAGPLAPREATLVAEDVCRALAVVHARGVVHRDVKARNIMRDRAGRVVLTDFGAGLSQQPTEDEAAAVGTPLYSAPETLRGAAATPSSDVYSVGVLLFHLVTGRYPFEGRTIEAIQAAQAAAPDGAAALVAVRPDLPASFVRVVGRALATTPAERYDSAEALLNDLVATHPTPPGLARLAARVVLAAGACVLTLWAAGLLASSTFNHALGRQAFVTETWRDHLGQGTRSLVLPAVLALLGLGGVGALLAVRNVLVAASASARSADGRVRRACERLASRLGMQDAGVAACWLTLVTAAAVAYVWTRHWPLIEASIWDASTAPRDLLWHLSPARENEPTKFRMALSLIGAASLALWYLLASTARARGERVPTWVAVAQVSVLVLLYASMQVPYRLAHDSGMFRTTSWRGQMCHEIGTRGSETLLFCANLQPRRHLVDTAREPLPPSGAPVHLFESFSQSSR